MNKYVLRTSLVWMVALVALGGIWAWRSHQGPQHPMSMPMAGDVQPIAVGPASDTAKPSSSMPGMSMTESKDAALVPVQLTPERMQSIGVKLGTVEYKQLADDIRASLQEALKYGRGEKADVIVHRVVPRAANARRARMKLGLPQRSGRA